MTRQLERAASLVGCFLTGIACGTMYLYSAFAPQLGLRLALNTTDTSKIGMIGNLGMALSGPFAGVLVDRHGFQAPIVIGAIFMGGGYTIIRLCYMNVVASVPTLACAMALVGTGGTFGFASAMKCAAVNFPNARGAATSVPMAAFGLSAFFFSTLFSTYYDGVTIDFLLALAIIPTILLALGLFTVRPLPPQHSRHHSRGGSGIEMYSQPSSPHSPMAASKEADADLKKSSVQAVDIHGFTLLKNSQFWKHFVIMGFVAGIGQMFIYSCGFSVKALQQQSTTVAGSHDSEQLQSLQVGAISIASFLGRIGSGYLCDLAASKSHPRSVLLIASTAASVLSQLGALSITDVHSFWMVSALSGLAYGVCFGSYPTILADSYGMKHFSQNWGLLSLAPIIPSYCLNLWYGMVYDSHSIVTERGARICTLGAQCYQEAFQLSFVCISAVACVVLWLVYREYRSGKK